MSDPSSRDPRSTITLLSDVISMLTRLVRREADLVRAEISESVARAVVAIGLIIGGVVFILVALNILTLALVAGLTELGIEAGWASLGVGVAYLLIAALLVRKGTIALRAVNLAPKRAMRSVRRDADVLKEKLHG